MLGRNMFGEAIDALVNMKRHVYIISTCAGLYRTEDRNPLLRPEADPIIFFSKISFKKNTQKKLLLYHWWTKTLSCQGPPK